MSKPTRVQREILERMATGETIVGETCLDPYQIGDRRIQCRTIASLIHRRWVALLGSPDRQSWYRLTDAGRIAAEAGKERVGP